MHYFHDGIEFAQLNLGQVHETLSGHKRSLCEAGTPMSLNKRHLLLLTLNLPKLPKQRHILRS